MEVVRLRQVSIDHQGQSVVAPDEDARDPLGGCMFRGDLERGGAGQEGVQREFGFEAGEGGTDAEVDAFAEGEVIAGSAVEADLVGVEEDCGVSVGGTPEQEQVTTCGEGDIAEGGVGLQAIPTRASFDDGDPRTAQRRRIRRRVADLSGGLVTVVFARN